MYLKTNIVGLSLLLKLVNFANILTLWHFIVFDVIFAFFFEAAERGRGGGGGAYAWTGH